MISWPLAQVFSVLVVCTTALVWKGVIPSHTFFAVGGAILGYLIPRAPSAAQLNQLALAIRTQRSAEVRRELEEFVQDEVPTSPGKRPDSSPSLALEKTEKPEKKS